MGKAVTNPNSSQGVNLAMWGRELQALVDKFTESFPTRLTVNGSAHLPSSGNVFLLTGTTGGLDSNVLGQLLQAPDVEYIYAFNRPSNSSTSQERHLSAFKQRGLDMSLL